MKKIKITTTSTILLLIITGISLNAQISMKTAIDRVKKNNCGIRAAEMKVEAKENNVSAAYGRFYPNIGVDFTYTHMDKSIVLDLDPIRSAMIQLQASNLTSMSELQQGKPYTNEEKLKKLSESIQKLEAGIPHFKETLKDQTFPQAIVSLQQPIFTGGKILAGVRAAEAQKKIEDYKVITETESIICDVISYYINVAMAQANLEVRNEAYIVVKEHASRAEKMLQAGLIASHDKLRADVALAEAERNLFEAQELLSIAKSALMLTLESNDENISISDSLIYKINNHSIDYYKELALSNNPNLLTLHYAKKALDEKANVKFADYLPTVFGYGFYNVFDNYIAEEEPKWGIGIGAHFEIFNGFRRTNEFQEAKAEAMAINYTKKEIENKIELLIRKQYMEMKLAENSYKKLDASLIQANENLRLNIKRFDTGLGTSLEVLDAQLAVESIKLKRIKALSDYYNNMSSLHKTIADTNGFVDFWTNN